MAKPQRSGLTGYSKEERQQEQKNKNEKPMEFEDEPQTSYIYKGDGQAQADFFSENSNFNELIESMSAREQLDFSDVWVPGYFMFGDQYRGFENMRYDLQRATRTFDKYLDQSVLRRSVVVHRLATAELVLGAGNKVGTLEELQAMKGKTVISIGNMSTGAGKHGLGIGSTTSTKGGYSTKSCEYRITIPGGSKGAGMWIGDKRINSSFGRAQREFMMNRDIRLTVGNTTYDSKRDCYVVELTYAGRLPHNYTHY